MLQGQDQWQWRRVSTLGRASQKWSERSSVERIGIETSKESQVRDASRVG